MGVSNRGNFSVDNLVDTSVLPDILEEAQRINKGNVLGPLDDGSPHSPEGSNLIIVVCGEYRGTQRDDHGNAKDNHHGVQDMPLEVLLIV